MLESCFIQIESPYLAFSSTVVLRIWRVMVIVVDAGDGAESFINGLDFDELDQIDQEMYLLMEL